MDTVAWLRAQSGALVRLHVCDPAFAVIQARRMLEAMLHDVVLEVRATTERRNGRGEGLDAWRQELVVAGVLSGMTDTAAQMVQRLGNIAAHPNPEQPGHFEAQPALLALMNVMRWFLQRRGLSTNELEELKEALRTARRSPNLYGDLQPAGEGVSIKKDKLDKLIEAQVLRLRADGLLERDTAHTFPALAAYEDFFERGLYRATPLGERVALTRGPELRETRNRWEQFLDGARMSAAPGSAARARQTPALLDPVDVDEAARMLRISSLLPTQRIAIDALRGGRDVVAVMPTGSGKSAIFQVAAMLGVGTALVVSPLVALMGDQVMKLRELGIAADSINHTIDGEARRRVLSDWLHGKTRLLYLSPEFALDDRTLEMLARVRTSVLAVDEAHLVSRWGHDFRPDYRALGRLRAAAKPGAVIALTATATPQVRDEVASVLAMDAPLHVVDTVSRTNLRYSGHVFTTEAMRRAALVERMAALGPRGAIIYVEQPSRAEQLAELLFRRLDVPTLPYHGELDAGQRGAVLEEFLSGRVPWVVGTKAFGLGLHRADVRLVLHAQMPDSIEMLVQGSGRAGRDGEPAEIEVWSAPGDIEGLVRRVQRSFVSLQSIRAIHDHVEHAGGPVTISREWLACFLGGTSNQHEVEARVAISLGEEMGSLQMHGRRGTEWTVSALRWPADAPTRYHDYVTVHRAARIHQIAEMVALASSVEDVDALTSRYFATGSIRG